MKEHNSLVCSEFKAGTSHRLGFFWCMHGAMVPLGPHLSPVLADEKGLSRSSSLQRLGAAPGGLLSWPGGLASLMRADEGRPPLCHFSNLAERLVDPAAVDLVYCAVGKPAGLAPASPHGPISALFGWSCTQKV